MARFQRITWRKKTSQNTWFYNALGIDRLAENGSDLVLYRNYTNAKSLIDLFKGSGFIPGLDVNRAPSNIAGNPIYSRVTDMNLCFLINGERALSGKVEVGGSKQSSLNLLGAILLVEGRVVITHFPEIADALNFVKIYDSFGVHVYHDLDEEKIYLDIKTV